MFLGNTVVLDEPLLGPAPESLKAVDVHPARRGPFLMIHIHVPISAEHKAVIAFEMSVQATLPRREVGFQ
jgi:hypothetical protein